VEKAVLAQPRATPGARPGIGKRACAVIESSRIKQDRWRTKRFPEVFPFNYTARGEKKPPPPLTHSLNRERFGPF